MEQLWNWKENIDSFIQNKATDHPEKPFIFRVFSALSKLEESHILTQIRRRVLLLLFHRLAQRLSPRRLAKSLHSHLVDLVSSRLISDQTSAMEKITDWKRRGGRYDKYFQELGGLGSVILLPYSIGHYE